MSAHTTPGEPDPHASRATWMIKSGFWRLSEIITSTGHSIRDEAEDETMTFQDATRQARKIVVPLWRSQLAVQESWPADEITVSDKLTRAFDSLERNHKIIARMNHECCQTCALATLGHDRDEDETKGYVFFHEQTTESVVEGGDVYLYHGSFTKSEKKNEEVARTIVRVLRRAGLTVQWEGDVGKAIVMSCEEWRRRLMVEEGDDEEEDDDYDTQEEEEEKEEGEEDDETEDEEGEGELEEMEVEELELEEEEYNLTQDGRSEAAS
ncbi:hypothetical protein AJ80_08927 [Polytolypa hystricis UAMH7299]|uniref:DUF6891 domain-containing protein n=1 Tax=Polytolypa hystricis (strain UAMH7299) TaxID=1447883 RepID=A0A2B7WZP1_POLH7|nr:hypothetical protein AJ80_08927 [Polytolypa hystricis UAMH7299]